jgi:TRAP-type C4-dicarboxylate transport system permease small subunit
VVSETLRPTRSPPALGIKVGYIYLSLPISGIFIVIFALESIVEIMTAGEWPPLPVQRED